MDLLIQKGNRIQDEENNPKAERKNATPKAIQKTGKVMITRNTKQKYFINY